MREKDNFMDKERFDGLHRARKITGEYHVQ